MKHLFIVASLFVGLSFSLSVEAQEEEKATKIEKTKKTEKPPKVEKSDNEEIADILDSMGYPELQVVPRASERLSMEAKHEKSTWYITHLPMELSGLMTLYVGLTADSYYKDDLSATELEDAKTYASIATAVGGATLVGAIALGAQRPYRMGMLSINKYQGKGMRDELMRERLAEEALEKPAKFMRIIQNIAVFANVGSNVLVGNSADEDGVVRAGLGALISFLPWVFEDRNITVYDKHIEYKRKIYSPVKTASYMHFNSANRSWTPMAGLTWEF
jgi:hypothetical protein